MPAFFNFLVWIIFSQNIFANGYTESSDKLCNLGLSRTQSSFSFKGVRYIMYMSLCKPLRDLPRKYISGLKYLDDLKIIILKKSQQSIDLLASASGDFTYDDDDGAKLELFSPNGLNYSVVISFECSQEENEPIFEDFRQESSSFIFKWQAPFACLLSHQYIRENCWLRFENNIFNMTSLTHPSHYALEEEDYKVYINFCGPVNLKECQSSGDVITGCIIHQNKTYVLENNVCEMTYVKRKSIEVEYCKMQPVTGIIEFQCKHDEFVIKPKLRVSKRRRRLSILIETSVVCLNDDRCDVNYDEERYSLPRTSNIMIKDTTGTFLLSVCGPLKSDTFWLGGETFASFINETVMSLGSKRSLGRSGKGQLTLTLTEGSFCPGTKQRAKTVVKFICSDEDNGPVFVDKFKNCVFSFQWEGPSYCPVLEATGIGCVVRDPVFGSNYRLGDDDDDDDEISHEDILFRINLCGKLKKPCHSDMDARVCLLTNDKEIVLGEGWSQTYSFKQGSLVLELWGSECATNVNYHVIVNVICEFGASDRFVPVLNESDSSCVFNFVWYTRKTCPKGEKLPCIVRHKNGSVADLNQLRLISSNYRVAKDDSYFLLNVCGPLWYGSNETCPPSSAACLVNKGKEFVSIGEVHNNLTVTDNNQIVLVYKNVNFLPFWETVIIFICDERNEGPQYIGTKDLKHSFEWKTKFACFNKTDSGKIKLEQVEFIPSHVPVKEEKPGEVLTVSSDSVSKGFLDAEVGSINRPPSQGSRERGEGYSSKSEDVSCITSDSQSFVDLSVLEPVFVSFSKCDRLYVDVCKKVYCVSSNSSESFRFGSRINRPTVDDRGFVTVNYYNDVLCGDHSNRSLSFIFVCDKSQSKGSPILKNQTSCSYTFLWNTRVVCPNEVLVLSKSEHSLINKSSNEVMVLEPSLTNPIRIERESESLYVNPLSSNVLDGEVPCSGDICEKKNDSWISYGILKSWISYDYNYNRIVMEFDGGDLCKGTRRYSSKIYLNCSENGISHPKSDDWAISRDYCELILELVTPCFEQKRSVGEAHVTIILLAVGGVLLVLLSMGFGYFTLRRKKRHSSCSEMMLIRNEHQKCLEKEL